MSLKRWWMDHTWRLRLTLPRLVRSLGPKKLRTAVPWDAVMDAVSEHYIPSIRAQFFAESPLARLSRQRYERFEYDA